MPRPRRSLAAVLLTLAACPSAPRGGTRPHIPSAATHDGAVYAAVLDRLVPAGKVAVVIDSTDVPMGGAAIVQDQDTELVRSFGEANQARQPLPNPLPSARAVRFTRNRDLPFVREKGNPDLEAMWRDFYQQFPGASTAVRLEVE